MYMLDHPGWDTADGTLNRAMRTQAGTWLIIAEGESQLISGSGDAPPVDTYEPVTLDLTALPPGLAHALRTLGPVRRWRNTDLWDALATAIIRQVIRAGQARKMHQMFRAAAGYKVAATALMPTPERVLAMSAEEFADLGMAFKRRPLQAAADAYLDHHAEWTQLPADVLVKALQAVPRIGPWTAGAAVADHTGDFSLYPYADLAVRTWAAAADPAGAWPADEPGFAATWRRLAGPHLSTLTVLTLAWGDDHARKPPVDSGAQPR
ncbi:DNA glycosylase family protein [Sphaerimonospora thailandensis]|uniref:DNA-3-methyladenine glycosylase II n=1 Tax=Sphaerimonospora thailandensis TaxID=795644 RepID=A0A8J3RAK6_9ACTN|nr:hypothetical protein [Sphaerimonospora thailandensis]GIH72172.1 hypothetical protein Mth01_44250 [Sphaerimonospora thailandensis]